MSSQAYYQSPEWSYHADGVCGEYRDARYLSSIRLWRKVVLWTVGCYLLMNQGFMLVRIPPGIPIGELVLALSLLLINLLVVLPRMSREIWIYPILLWWGYSFLRILIDLKVGGVWTFRDASQEIESLYLIVGFWMINGVETLHYFFSWMRHILLVLGLYGLLLPVLPTLQKYSPSISHMNASESSLFFQYIGTAELSLWAAVWLLMESHGKRDQRALFRKMLAVVLVAVTVAFAQERTVDFQVIGLGFVFLFLRRRLAVWWGVILLTGILIIGFISISGVTLTGRLGQKVSLDFIVQHLESVTGQNATEQTAGAAGGIDLRKEWWARIATQMVESPKNMAFGLGFGIPLTNDVAKEGVPTREPHDSFISVWARLGAVGLTIFLLMQAMLYRTLWNNFKICRRMGWEQDQRNLVLLLIFGFLMLVYAIGEDALEKPYIAIPYYLFFGVMLRYGRYIRNAIEPAALAPQSPKGQTAP